MNFSGVARWTFVRSIVGLISGGGHANQVAPLTDATSDSTSPRTTISSPKTASGTCRDAERSSLLPVADKRREKRRVTNNVADQSTDAANKTKLYSGSGMDDTFAKSNSSLNGEFTLSSSGPFYSSN